MRRLPIGSWVILGALGSTSALAADFTRDVRPILARSCVGCHGGGKQGGALRLDRRDAALAGGKHGPAWSPGHAAGSLVIEAVEGRLEGVERMPRGKDALSRQEIDVLRRWIDEGADWPEGAGPIEAARAGRDWWSLQPLRAVIPPSPASLPVGWGGAIDRFVFDAMASQGLVPGPEADRRALIRRVTYDVLGLPPTPEEVEAFVADDSTTAYASLVDRLLASPRYGERWGRFWLDIARFGESNGYERNFLYSNAWPYRDYVIDSLNEDKPFDRFVVEQLAADVAAPGDASVESATAFLVCGPFDDVGNQDAAAAAQIRANHLDDMVRATSEAFLAMTVGCARCHDHKFDPIPTSDYYRMQSAFAGVWHGSRTFASAAEREARDSALRPLEAERERLGKERATLEAEITGRATGAARESSFALGPPDPYGTEDAFDAIDARAVRLVILANNQDPRGGGGARIDEIEVWSDGPVPRNVALTREGAKAEGASARVAEDFAGAYGPASVNDGSFSAKWIAAPGAILTITLPRVERIRRVMFSVDRNRELPRESGENVFVGEYRIEVSRDGSEWTIVADSSRRAPVNEAFARERILRREMREEERARLARIAGQIDGVNARMGAVPGFRQTWAGEMRQPSANAYVMLGGDPQRRGEEIAPGSLMALPEAGSFRLEKDAPEAERRLALARWIVAPSNPLTPRVLANRIWQSHFGVGIVDTPSDFGWLGGRPSHPGLLDWLAGRLLEQGWRLKPLQREILLSAAYRQRSSRSPRDYRSQRDPRDVDAGDRLLWQFPPRRLSAEEIRDTMLAISGQLDLKQGGPGFRMYRYLQDNVSTYVPLDVQGPETYRRAVYHQNPRALRVDFLGDFDCPDNSVAAPTRTLTTSPLQALTMLNHQFTLDMAAFLAARLEREAGNSLPAQVRRLFELSFGRAPTRDESVAAGALATRYGLRALCRAQLNASELLYVE